MRYIALLAQIKKYVAPNGTTHRKTLLDSVAIQFNLRQDMTSKLFNKSLPILENIKLYRYYNTT